MKKNHPQESYMCEVTKYGVYAAQYFNLFGESLRVSIPSENNNTVFIDLPLMNKTKYFLLVDALEKFKVLFSREDETNESA